MKVSKIWFDQGQVILTDEDGHAYSFKATRLKEIAYMAISYAPSSQKELWDSHFLDFYRSQEFFNSGYTIKEFDNNFITIALNGNEVEVPVNWVAFYNSTLEGYFLTETSEEVSGKVNLVVNYHDLLWQGYSKDDVLAGRFELIDHCKSYA